MRPLQLWCLLLAASARSFDFDDEVVADEPEDQSVVMALALDGQGFPVGGSKPCGGVFEEPGRRGGRGARTGEIGAR